MGGDWYDAFLQPAGATVVVIGDVVGHDIGAAAAMGQLRGLLRGIAYGSPAGPAAILHRVDAAMGGLRLETLATAVVARIEQRAASAPAGAPRLAGPTPATRRRCSCTADGGVEVLAEPGDLLLGFDPGAERTDREVGPARRR